MELRQATPQPVRAIAGVATMGIVLLAWWFLTWGATAEERIISPAVLPSPMEVVRSFPSLWYDRALSSPPPGWGPSMLPFLLTALLLATPDEPPAARPVPDLPRSPKVDGALGDFRGGICEGRVEVKSPLKRGQRQIEVSWQMPIVVPIRVVLPAPKRQLRFGVLRQQPGRHGTRRAFGL